MKKINVLKKRSFYLLGSLFALISSYIIAENAAKTDHTVAKVTIPEAHADVPAADASWTGDDGGDGN